MFEEIEPVFVKMFEMQHTSIFVTVAEGCKKFQAKQSQFIHAVTAALESESNSEGTGDQPKKKKNKDGNESSTKLTENFILCCAKFGQKSPVKEDGNPMFMTDFCGTMVLQQMMEFHKPTKVRT
jgi:hypothetical protein